VEGPLLLAGEAEDEVVEFEGQMQKLRVGRVVLLQTGLQVDFESFEE
jgi:hypothetical protein